MKFLELAIYTSAPKPPKTKIKYLLFDLMCLTHSLRFDVERLMLSLDQLSRLGLLKPNHEIILTAAWGSLARTERFLSGDMTETKEWKHILEDTVTTLRSRNKPPRQQDRTNG